MSIKITTTKDYSSGGVKVLLHAPAGYEKTRLCATAPNPIIISNESGLLSLQDEDIPVIEVFNKTDLDDAYHFITSSKEAEQYQTICLDSISEIAEVLLTTYKKEEKDPRAAYGRMNDDIAITIRAFRDIQNKHVYFAAKQTRVEADGQPLRFMPSMPGKVSLNATSYYFDLVGAIRVGKLEDETVYKYIQTYGDINYEAKDRSGRLLPKEKPDLTYIFNKITNKKKEN